MYAHSVYEDDTYNHNAGRALRFKSPKANEYWMIIQIRNCTNYATIVYNIQKADAITYSLL